MKTRLVTLIIGLGAIAAVSCNKCKVCTKTDAAAITYCDKDFESKIKYDLAVKDLENAGYTCNEQ